MKRAVLLSLFFVLICTGISISAGTPPIVQLLFDDAAATSTANLGTLGGTQNLPPGNGWKENTNLPPVSFDSGNAWCQSGYSSTGYGTYSLPAMSAVTVAFWVDSVYVDTSWRNIFSSNLGTSSPFGAYIIGSNLVLRGPSGDITATNVIPTGTPTWTHVAYSYD